MFSPRSDIDREVSSGSSPSRERSLRDDEMLKSPNFVRCWNEYFVGSRFPDHSAEGADDDYDMVRVIAIK